jgi:mono/diheme cytochrome c family protein
MKAQRFVATIGRAAALAALTAAAAVGAQEGAAVRGKAKFDHSCAPCHGAGRGDDGREMLPGTDALRLKYRGSVPAVLEQRSDLTAATLKAFVRSGTFSMPPFRPTEVTDAEIEDIAAYLAESSKAAR